MSQLRKKERNLSLFRESIVSGGDYWSLATNWDDYISENVFVSCDTLQKIMSSEVEETLKRINSHKGVKGVLIMNSEGRFSPYISIQIDYQRFDSVLTHLQRYAFPRDFN